MCVCMLLFLVSLVAARQVYIQSLPYQPMDGAVMVGPGSQAPASYATGYNMQGQQYPGNQYTGYAPPQSQQQVDQYKPSPY